MKRLQNGWGARSTGTKNQSLKEQQRFHYHMGKSFIVNNMGWWPLLLKSCLPLDPYSSQFFTIDGGSHKHLISNYKILQLMEMRIYRNDLELLQWPQMTFDHSGEITGLHFYDEFMSWIYGRLFWNRGQLWFPSNAHPDENFLQSRKTP